MVKLVYCIRRKQGSRDEFRRYWAEVHGPTLAVMLSTIVVRSEAP